MASHPLNLALRFLLEIAALVAFGYWGWTQGAGVLRWLLGIGLPLIAAAAWGTFNVPDDPSRSGRAPVRVPGLVRLALEVVFFGLAVWAVFAVGQPRWAWMLIGLLLVHYAKSYDRLIWLLRH